MERYHRKRFIVYNPSLAPLLAIHAKFLGSTKDVSRGHTPASVPMSDSVLEAKSGKWGTRISAVKEMFYLQGVCMSEILYVSLFIEMPFGIKRHKIII